MSVIEEIKQAIIDGKMDIAVELTNKAVSQGSGPDMIIQDGLIPAMDVVGRRFQSGECYIPEMLVAARAMKAAMGVLKPLMVGMEVKKTAKVVLGTVKGDLHDIGKNLVGIMMEGAGMEVIDLGVDVSPERFVEAVKAHRPDLVAISALLTTTMPNMQATIEAFQEAGIKDSVRVLVGGAPVTRKFAAQIGADGYGENAAEAVDVVKSLLNTKP